MKPLSNLQQWLERIVEDTAADVLSEEERVLWKEMPTEQKRKYLTDLLTKPVLFEDPEIIYSWYLRSKWADVLKTIENGKALSLFEVGCGDNDPVPQAMAAVIPGKETKYVTANMNKELTESFRQKTKHLPISVDIIEDDAQNIKRYSEATGLFDIVAFEHSVNDVIEAMLGERNQIDTTNNHWMTILPRLTEIVASSYQNKTFEKDVKEELLNLFSTCMAILKPGGYIAVNHYQFQYNLDVGMDPELWENLVPIVRKWVQETDLGKEVFFDGFDPQWWMFIQKV